MKMSVAARYLGIVFLVVISLVPQFITGVIVGSFNLIFLLVLWVILVICFLKVNARWATTLALFGGLAMAVPPVPYYLLVLENGFQFHFIGWNNMGWQAAYGILFFFAFYVTIFVATALLLRGRHST